jgi:non-ribosomal peptide synthetase-like protein
MPIEAARRHQPALPSRSLVSTMNTLEIKPRFAPEVGLSLPAHAADFNDELRDLIPEQPARLHHFFERQADARGDALAVVSGADRLTYASLDARANRLAQYLLSRGAGPGRTVGILLNRSTHTYVALLAVLKAGSAFVPMDPSYPGDRVAFMAADAGLALILTTSDLAASHTGLPCPAVCLDRESSAVGAMPSTRPFLSEEGDALAYIIYTSGTTGRPKGVAVTHANICHFLSVCAPVYAVGPSDRVYQGMTIAFDFSIEEIWPAFIAGATLVAGPTDGRKLGPGLAEFLIGQHISVFCCVPTLLATLDRDVPSIHTLIVGGEACPRDLVERWSRPERRMLNTYGPTETTVTATWCELEPGRPVTIGRPMPGYRVYVLDEALRPVPLGESGEICIGGAGVAQGYINRPDLTADKFVPDPFEPGRRLYRSGDLGRFTPAGEVEFLGRIDTQVKIRGYRIELAEIEAAILDDPAVENAVVAAYPTGAPAQDLAAYITLRAPQPIEPVRERLAEELRRRLPVYMVPAYIEVVDAMPVLASGKVDRRSLPAPVLPRVAFQGSAYEAPATPLERKIAAMWQAVFGLERISADSDFFLDLGGHSLLAAQLLARLRQHSEMAALSIADVYAHPTIRALAAHVPSQSETTQAAPERPRQSYSSRRVWTAGLVQFGLLYALLCVLGAPVSLFMAAHGGGAALAFTGIDLLMPLVVVLVSFLVPPALKWLLIGRFQPGEHDLWSWYFCRWWVVRKALDFSPLHFLAGSPLMPVYARLLGARVAPGCQIATAQLHLPDLVEIGEGAAIGYDAEIQPFVIEGGRLRMAPIRIGAGAFIGTKSVVLAGAVIGRGARIAEQTLVASGRKIPEFETWAGSPAQRTESRDGMLAEIEALGQAPVRMGPALWAAFVTAAFAIEALPMAAAIPGFLLIAWADRVGGPLAALTATPFAGLLFVLGMCLAIFAGKRAVMPKARPGIYPQHSWFGLRKWISDQLMGLSLTTTNTLYATLYTLPWLRALGARIGPRSEVSTVSHIDPDLLTLGSETFVADIASIGAAAFHRGWVALARTEIGSRTFLGNASAIHGGRSVPENCLIGVQSVAPREGLRAGSSWLGSPAIFLPRRQASQSFAETLTYKPPRRLVAYRLFVEFFRVVLPAALLYAVGVAAVIAGVRLLPHAAPALVLAMPALFLAASVVVTMAVAALKWAIVGRYRTRVEPLWAPFVRHSELITGLYESFTVPALAMLLTGTPWLAPVLRLFGVRMGRRVYCETTFMTEFDLVRIGDDAVIGRAASLQSHLFEDRVMKMSAVTIGAGAAIGTRAVVLYDAVVGEEASLDALSLAMKGESIPPATRWQGIPARSA